MDNVTDAKRMLRTRIRAQRASRAGTGERDHRDRALFTHLLAELDRRDAAWDDAHDTGTTSPAVAAYQPMPGEPGGADLADRLAATGRTVWLPVVVAPGSPLRWVRWRGNRHTRTGAFGIREPVPSGDGESCDTATMLTTVRTVVVPALAVGHDGVRLGQGGGFYDRSLTASRPDRSEHGRLIAVVDHEEFGVPVPATDLDIAVPVVVTDTGVFRTRAHHP